MALNYNLTNQEIKDTFQQLAQVSGSISSSVDMGVGSAILDGSGSRVTNLHVTASHAVSSSFADLAKSATTATNADTASFFGEGIVTASAVASTITFTKDSGVTFDVTVAQSGSVESASYANFASNAESASYATSASSAIYTVSSSYAINATSASHALISDTSLLATTASHAVSALSASHALEADHAAQADDLLINVKNLSGETLAKGTAVHATGVTGENVTVIKADASIAGNMPAVALLNEQLTDNSVGQAIIAGRLIGINTSALVAGESVYVNVDGGLTSTKPTGSLLIQNIGTAAKINASDGEVIIQGSGRSNDLPNLTSGYAWVGNSDGVPTAVTTSSLLIHSASTATSASHALASDTSISASHAVQADSASFVNTLNQSVIISGSKLEIEGANSNDGLYVEGGGVNINAKGTKQYGNVRQYYDTDKWSGNFNGYQIINNASGSDKFTSLMAISTFTGYDSSDPVFYIQGGGNNGTYQNTILRSSLNKPWVNITKQASFDNAITASAVISASGGIEGSLTGDVTGNISSSGTSTFNDISVTGTGSFAYIQSVTGSQKIIGESFIVLSNDTPALRYAGMKVYDSGSTNATASLEWDGLSDNWIIAEESGNTGVLLTGVTGSRGSEALPTLNSLQKGAGHHSLTNSNISDNGSKVTINSATDITGSVNVSANNITVFNSNNSAIAIGDSSNPQQFAQSRIYNNIDTYDGSLYNAFNLVDNGSATDGWDAGMEVTTFASAYDGNNKVFRIGGGGSTGPNGGYTNNQYILTATTTGGKVYQHKDTEFESNVKFNQAITGSIISASTSITSADITLTGDLTANEVTASALQVNGIIDADNINIGSGTNAVQFGNRINYYDSEKNTGNIYQAWQFVDNASGSTDFASQLEITTYSGLDSTGGINQPVLRLRGGGDNGVNGNTIIWSSYNKPQAHFAKDSIFQSDVDVQGDLQVDGVSTLSGSVVTSGSVATEVISGSHDGSNIYIDYSKGNMFDVELKSGSNLVIEAQNIQKGQTAMLQLRQPTATGAFGSIDFADAYLFPGGTHPQATQASGSVDVLTFTSFDGTTLAGTSVLNLK